MHCNSRQFLCNWKSHIRVQGAWTQCPSFPPAPAILHLKSLLSSHTDKLSQETYSVGSGQKEFSNSRLSFNVAPYSRVASWAVNQKGFLSPGEQNDRVHVISFCRSNLLPSCALPEAGKELGAAAGVEVRQILEQLAAKEKKNPKERKKKRSGTANRHISSEQ